jgi:hypothetical protein
MTSRNRLLATAVAVFAAAVSSLPAPAMAKMPGHGESYIQGCFDTQCTNEEGDKRRLACTVL